MLRRVLKYGRKVFNLTDELDSVTDSRKMPDIPTSVIVRNAFAMMLSGQGSLNAAEQSSSCAFWKTWLGYKAPSADTIGRVMALADSGELRKIQKKTYARLKRNKVHQKSFGGFFALALDGHESNASYLRSTPECLERKIQTEKGEKTQYYHRHIMAILIFRNFCLLLDVEPQKPGEDEVAAAIRLLERVFRDYPRAFDVILADGLYAKSTFFNFVTSHPGKHVVAVLKNEERELMKDARNLCALTEPITFRSGPLTKMMWDISGCTSWPQVEEAVRVVRSVECRQVNRQLDKNDVDKKPDEVLSDWVWVTTIPASAANTEVIASLGHARWSVENQGFNETTKYWHADHIYKNDDKAILNFHLLLLAAYNIFHTFFWRNLKQNAVRGVTKLHICQLIRADLYGTCSAGPRLLPP